MAEYITCRNKTDWILRADSLKGVHSQPLLGKNGFKSFQKNTITMGVGEGVKIHWLSANFMSQSIDVLADAFIVPQVKFWNIEINAV